MTSVAGQGVFDSYRAPLLSQMLGQQGRGLAQIIFTDLDFAVTNAMTGFDSMSGRAESRGIMLPVLIRELSLHIAVGNLPRSLMCDLAWSPYGMEPVSGSTAHALMQQQVWMYLSAGCPLAEITLMPEGHPGQAQLAAIRAGLQKVDSQACTCTALPAVGSTGCMQCIMRMHVQHSCLRPQRSESAALRRSSSRLCHIRCFELMGSSVNL